ncbi:MAG: hypothetical protein MUC49_02020 [Raineya sp.]|jgi:hypothetical protein|nr:hypothetical protein [Raineya sp.]
MPIALVILLEIFIKIIQISLVLACLFIFLTGIVYLDSIVQRYFSSQKNLTKINKNKRLKAFANKHKFLFFRDRWKGYYKSYFTEIKIEYEPPYYQFSLFIKIPIESGLGYDLKKVPEKYLCWYDTRFIRIQRNVTLIISYPKTRKIEQYLDEMILQVKKYQVKI